MKHPFIVGGATALVGLVVWRRRAWFVGLFQRITSSFHGFGAGPIALPANADPSVVVRQLQRYTFATMQDKSPIVGLTHASYALILLDTLEEMVGRDAIVSAGYDPVKIRKVVTTCQDGHAEKLKACDGYMTSVLALARAGGDFAGFEDGMGSAPRGA